MIEILISVSALTAAIVAILYSKTSIQISLFKERYAIYYEIKRLILQKLTGESHLNPADKNLAKCNKSGGYSIPAISKNNDLKITDNDIKEVDDLISMTKFLFKKNESIISCLNEIKKDLTHYSKLKSENMTDSEFVDSFSIHEKNLKKWNRILNDKKIEKIFEIYLSDSPWALINCNWFIFPPPIIGIILLFFLR